MKKQKISEMVIGLLCIEGLVDRIRNIKVYANALSLKNFTGFLAMVLAVLLFLSGAFMAFYYTPAPGVSYDSVDFAMFDLPFGEIIKGIHHYSWNFLLLVMGVHLIRSFILGTYKPPRHLVWVSGVLIFLVIPLFIITGDLLPWDQRGFWSTKVRLSIIGSVPVLGDFFVRLLQGGPLTGIVALTRFYVLHILFLPSLLAILIVIHFHLLNHHGIAEPLYKNRSDAKRIPFFPSLINRWLFLFILTTVILVIVSWFWPPPFGDPADPTDSTYVPKPEWWVLFLNQLVSIFKGPLSIVGTVIIPGGLAGILLSLPYLDRTRERAPKKRMKLIIAGAIIVVTLIGFSISGYIEHLGA